MQISAPFAYFMGLVKKYDHINVVMDDSGSMTNDLFWDDDENAFRGKEVDKGRTRWHHLQEEARDQIEMFTAVRSVTEPNWDDDWISQWFLNNTGHDKTNIKSKDDLQFPGKESVRKRTPIVRTLTKVFSDDRMESELPVYTMIMTDGLATDEEGYTGRKKRMERFKEYLTDTQAKYPNSYVSINIYTITKSVLNEYENAFDGIPRVDVRQIYPHEKQEIQLIQESQFSYTKSDHLAKGALAPYVPFMDSWDEKKLTAEQFRHFEESYKGKPAQPEEASAVVGGTTSKPPSKSKRLLGKMFGRNP